MRRKAPACPEASAGSVRRRCHHPTATRAARPAILSGTTLPYAACSYWPGSSRSAAAVSSPLPPATRTRTGAARL